MSTVLEKDRIPTPGNDQLTAPASSSKTSLSLTPSVSSRKMANETTETVVDDRTIAGFDEKSENLDASPLDNVVESETAADGNAPQDGVLEGMRLWLVFLAMMASVFMFALDQSIVATAIPVIVSEFNSFAMVGWVITAYFLTQCGFILLVGQLLTAFKAKWILLWAIFWFEVGSLICALAKNMTMLIVARAIQGLGASGMFVSIIAVIAVVTKVEKRAGFLAGFGFVFVISSVIGPLLGGVFTEHLTWRWCFWINLPFGGVAVAAVLFLLPAHAPQQQRDENGEVIVKPGGWRVLLTMDWIGSGLTLAFVTCLLLALQWGGNEYPWHNWRIIILFVIGGLLVIAFFGWEVYLGSNALIPPALMKNRTIIAASVTIFMLMLAMLGGTYQLPLYYQAGRNRSPQQSGIDIIPFMILVCFGIFFSGGFVQKFGYYYPFLLIGPPIAAVGFGLFYTIRENTSKASVIGYQVLAGFGIGLTFQNIILSAQAEFAKRPSLIPQATGIVSFFQLTGAAIGIGIVNTVQSVYLNRYLKQYAPMAPFEVVRQSTQATYKLPLELQKPVIHAYLLAISKSYIPIFVALALSIVSGAFIRNHNMLKVGVQPGVHV